MKLRWLVGLWVGLALIGPAVVAPGPALTRGPYLQSTMRDSAIVVWQTDIAGDSVLQYGESGFTHAISATASIATTHVISVTGLTAGTIYRYRILTGGTVLHEASFATAPNPGRAFSFVVIGDSGTGFQAQHNVAAQMRALNPDFMLHAGDVIYPSGQAGGYDPYFFAPYAGLLDHMPVFPVLGNHDYVTANGQPYLDAFYLPAAGPGGERYYSFDWGAAHFVALDSNQAYQPGSTMYQWLEADLAQSTAKWKFAFFHHAIYTSGLHGRDSYVTPMRDALAPLFEKYEVDVVFNGHDHTYERSTPRRDYVPGASGVIYIVSGGGGADLYAVGRSPFTAYSASVHHTVQVQIDGCILSLRAIDTTGSVFDQIALSKCPHQFYLPVLLKQI